MNKHKYTTATSYKVWRIHWNKKAFTLVELIIVISILAILSTIALSFFSGFLQTSRDANRMTTLKNISSALWVFYIRTGFYPIPDEKVEITWSGVFINQWIVWNTLKNLLNAQWNMLDPKDKTNYLYSTDWNQSSFQLWAYLEENNFLTYFPTSYASDIDYSNRYFYTIWDKVWIFLKNNNGPPVSLDDYPEWINLEDVQDEFIVYFSNDSDDSVSWSWEYLIEKIIEITNNQSNNQSNNDVIYSSCWSDSHNTKRFFYNISSVAYWESCPAWVEFTCNDWEWINDTYEKQDYSYNSCIVWENNCSLTNNWSWIILSNDNASCSLYN